MRKSLFLFKGDVENMVLTATSRLLHVFSRIIYGILQAKQIHQMTVFIKYLTVLLVHCPTISKQKKRQDLNC